MLHCSKPRSNETKHFLAEGLKLDIWWCIAEVLVSLPVVLSLTGLLFLLAAALSSSVQHHLLDDLHLLIHPREVEICALSGHRGKI